MVCDESWEGVGKEQPERDPQISFCCGLWERQLTLCSGANVRMLDDTLAASLPTHSALSNGALDEILQKALMWSHSQHSPRRVRSPWPLLEHRMVHALASAAYHHHYTSRKKDSPPRWMFKDLLVCTQQADAEIVTDCNWKPAGMGWTSTRVGGAMAHTSEVQPIPQVSSCHDHWQTLRG